MMNRKTLIKLLYTVGIIICFSAMSIGQVPVDKLIAKYPFNATFNDETGNGNNASSNGSTFTTDRFNHENRAMNNQSSPAHVSLGKLQELSDHLDSFAFSFWMKSDDPQINSVIFGSTNDAGAGMHLAFGIKSDSSAVFTLRSKDGKTLRFLSNMDHVFDSSWHHVVITVKHAKDNQIDFYIDNEINPITLTHSMSPNAFESFTYPFAFGAWNNRGTIEQQFKGSLDDLRIYKRHLTSSDVYKLYSVGTCFKTVYDTVSISVTDTLYINVSTAGIPTTIVGQVLVYPNPTSSYFTVQTTSQSQLSSYTLDIYNAQGKWVKTLNLDKSNQVVNVSDLQGKGTYFIHIRDKQGEVIQTKTLIIQ